MYVCMYIVLLYIEDSIYVCIYECMYVFIALLRPGRIDRKIEFPNPTAISRADIIGIVIINLAVFFITECVCVCWY
jgi:hypothetical protein